MSDRQTEDDSQINSQHAAAAHGCQPGGRGLGQPEVALADHHKQQPLEVEGHQRGQDVRYQDPPGHVYCLPQVGMSGYHFFQISGYLDIMDLDNVWILVKYHDYHLFSWIPGYLDSQITQK